MLVGKSSVESGEGAGDGTASSLQGHRHDAGMDASKPLIIFIHGYFGSHLVSKRGGCCGCCGRKWLSYCTILRAFCRCNGGHRSLALPLTWDGDAQDTDNLEPGTPVSLAYAGLLAWLHRLEAQGLADVDCLCWDWRRAFEETEAKIAAHIEDRLGGGSRKAVLLSHSTGSLLAWPSVNRHPEFFSAWVTAGGALGASELGLKDLAIGSRGPGCLKLINAETMGTFPSCYGFFAVRGTDDGTPAETVDDEKGNLDWDAYDVREWEQRGLGIFGLRGQRVTDAERLHVHNSLQAGKRFRLEHFVRPSSPVGPSDASDHNDAFLARPRAEYASLKIIAYGSDDYNTHLCWQTDDGVSNGGEGAKVPGNIRLDLPDVKAPGDGTIRSGNWRKIPGGLPFEVVPSTSRHVKLCDDRQLHELLAGLLGVIHRGDQPGR